MNQRSNNKAIKNYQIYSPGSHIKESSRKNQCPKSMALTKQNLKHKIIDRLVIISKETPNIDPIKKRIHSAWGEKEEGKT